MTTLRPHRIVLTFAIATMLLAGGATTVLGHAALATVTPADKATVPGSPTQIVMTFVQNLDPSKSNIKIVDAGGTVVAQGGTVPSGKPREMDLALTSPLLAGSYTIRFTTFSTEDGELDHGTTTFTIAATQSASPTASSVPSPSAAASGAPSASAAGAVTSSPAASAPPATPAASTSDAVIPVVMALLVLAALGLWLLRARSRSAR